ncbi:hypothetical protein FOMG_09739 [Fusarium oxysporum f. sp. melonis 26406]|uniref:Xylanolytic transcriptional activator regulatory domain-containing protein n=1 Tax=Fusarium oxysporum f. sp. melonis 26406 TaxID=1089452 RepID=W9ZYV6_FUSOX|nr:hypothetical protein FOMG_09739 [Fusarium oxysporum f. sp. melonis 26406]
MLLYAVCAVGALVAHDTALAELSTTFARHSERLVLESLETPDLTKLQALLILGQLEIGHGHSSKGWLYCGMAFRLTHEMGLHLDPNNWSQGGSDNSRTASTADREVLRRVYWAAFVLDKQLSLYFGRSPALYPDEADPPEWEWLLDTYISKDTSVTAFEDGIALVGAFVHWVELAKIFHTMIVDVFENRRKTNNQAVMETAHQVHLAMERWMSTLPQKLHWSQWTVTSVPHYVLHVHMLFHTGMIILHRPPRKRLENT